MKFRKGLATIIAVMMILSTLAVASAYSATTPTASSPWFGSCNATDVRIRSTASTSGSILGILNSGDCIEIIGSTGSWYKVRYSRFGDTGYVYAQYLDTVSKKYGHVYNAPSGLNYRDQPGTNGTNILYSVPNGTYMPYNWSLYIEQGMWYGCLNGRTGGWVSGTYFSV